MIRTGATVLLALILSASVLAQPQIQPQTPLSIEKHARLSGIIADKTRRVAIVEMPNGGTVMARVGDTFDGGRVVEITKQTMRVHYPDGDRLFGVAFSGSRAISADNSPSVADKGDAPVVEKRDAGVALMRAMNREAAIKRLDGLLAAGNSKSGLNEMLNPLLELPQQVNIVEINHKPLGTTKENIASIRQSFVQGNVVSLTISGYPGKRQVYLMPKGDNIAKQGK